MLCIIESIIEHYQPAISVEGYNWGELIDKGKKAGMKQTSVQGGVPV